MSFAQTKGLTTEQLQSGIKNFETNISNLYRSVNIPQGQPLSHQETAFLIDKNRDFISQFEKALQQQTASMQEGVTKAPINPIALMILVALGLLIIGSRR